MSIMILLIALALWGIVHSILASNFVKDMLGGKSFFRLGYNLFAVLSFAPVLYLMKTLPDQIVYQIPAPWSFLMAGGQIFSALMLLTAFLQTDSLSFIGLRQLFEKAAPAQLVTRGLYRVVRHPLYTFGLLFIWLSANVSQNSLTLYIGATLYTLIGAYFEERKLLREFGDAYAAYREVTPMLIPGLAFGKK
jgi:protein-S-isoprenylcysteine O-methyltransferase Ste14